jgi:hypothetical protein
LALVTDLNSKKRTLKGTKLLAKSRVKMNERITEDIVRSHFKNDSMYESIKLEEQRTQNERLKELLKSSSKKGSGKAGYPEFIITFPTIMDLVIITECKYELKDHRLISDTVQSSEVFDVLFNLGC